MNERAAKLCGRERYTFEDLCEIMEILRGEGGCPWDREQTHESIRNSFIEETYEAVEGIDNGDMALLREELGDVLLQVVFHSEMERERGVFDVGDVITDECKKLISRHPHIFADGRAETSADVLDAWDKIKAEEKKRKTTGQKLRSIPPALPALMRADKLGVISKKAGFDFPTAEDAFSKITEETEEVEEALSSGDGEALYEEIGDLLLAVVNTARLCGIDAERGLSSACDKYCSRYERLEAELAARGLSSESLGMDELDKVWDEIKHAPDKREKTE